MIECDPQACLEIAEIQKGVIINLSYGMVAFTIGIIFGKIAENKRIQNNE